MGVDLVRVSRIEGAVGRWGNRFLNRVFTPAEVEACSRCSKQGKPQGARGGYYGSDDGWHSGFKPDPRRLAGRFAAKEAILKAVGIGLRYSRWLEMEILNDSLGKPKLTCRGALLKIMEDMGVTDLDLSISHTDEFAMAGVILVVGSHIRADEDRRFDGH